MQYIKNVYRKIQNKYEKTCLNIIDYLDRELNYQQSLKYYTDQIEIKNLTMEYEAYEINNEIFSLSSMPEPAIEEIIRINRNDLI